MWIFEKNKEYTKNKKNFNGRDMTPLSSLEHTPDYDNKISM